MKSVVAKRDYDMLLLLATYGLRSIEVIHLSLDDIDWRTSKLSAFPGQQGKREPNTGAASDHVWTLWAVISWRVQLT